MHLDRVMTGHTDITIRAWQRRDLEQVQALLTLLSDDAVARSEGAPTYVAETDGRVVGMVTLCVVRTLTGPKAYVDHLVVAPGWRRRGIGRALVQHAIERARGSGRFANRPDRQHREGGWARALSVTRLSRA